MNKELLEKANSLMYGLTKNAARHDFSEFLEDWGLTEEDYAAIKKEITAKTGIEFNYL